MRDVLVQRPKFRKSSSLLPRFLSASALIPVSLYLIYKGPPFSLILGGGAALFLLGEWGVLWMRCPFSFIPKIIYGLSGLLYLGLSIGWCLLNLSVHESWRLMFWLLFLVWSGDTGAYFGGKFFKGPKLAPSISPNKTWSGGLMGVVLGTIIGYTASLWLIPGIFSVLNIISLALVAQGGDLLESQAKRWSRVKDSGALIPGHGGVLDRLDSLLAVAFVLAFWQLLF